jgi:hypothetical protein
MRPTSFMNSIPTLLSLKRKVIKSLLATPSSPSVARPYEVAGTEESPMSRSWYRSMVERIFSAITNAAHNTKYRERENAKETEPKGGIWRGRVGHDWLTVLVGNYGKMTHCTRKGEVGHDWLREFWVLMGSERCERERERQHKPKP